MVRLVLMCGLAGAGKSTYARALEAAGSVRFSIDAEAWRSGYADAAAIPADLAAGIRDRQRGEIAAALDDGRDVVVDYSFHARAQRDEYRRLGRAHGAEVEVVHLASDPDVLRQRLAARRGSGPDDFTVDPGLLETYLAGFEAPGPDERDVTVVPVQS